MKSLHLMRHAKSSWDSPQLSDRDRPLNKRGQRDAPRMGAALAQQLEPVSIFVSPARRAQLTLEGLCNGWPALGELTHVTDEDLYTFSSGDLVTWMQAQSDSQNLLFIIGHNPAFTDLVNFLTGQFSLENLPTAGYVQLELNIDQWQDLLQGCAVIKHSLLPKQLGKH